MVRRHDLPPAGMTGAADPATDPSRPGNDGVTDRAAEAVAAPSAEAVAAPSWESVTAGEVLSAYLHAQAGDFLRSLRLHRESGSDVQEAAEAARLLRRAARRISGALYVYRPLTDTAWSDELRTELAWLSGTLAREHAYAERLERLRGALHRLSGAGGPSDRSTQGEAEVTTPGERLPDGAVGAAHTASANAAHATATSAARTARGGVTVAVDGVGGPSGAPGAPGSVPRSPRAARRSVSLAAGAPGGGAADPVGGQGARPGPADTGGGAEGAAGTSRDRDEGRTAGRRRVERGDKGGRGTKGEKGERTGQPGAAHQRAGAEEEARGGALTVGAARAGALLERQLTLARTRAHTAALEALGSSRFHAVADTVALLASEAPLDEAGAARPAGQVLPPLADLANRRLTEAVEALPLIRAGHPYNAEALVHGLAATSAADAPPASERQDAPWHQVRHLLRLRRYALEVLDRAAWQREGPGGANGTGPTGPGAADAEPPLSVRLLAAGQALERHRDAAEAAAAAAAAARTPRIAPATAYALGVLHADQRHEVEAARFAFGRIWRRVAARSS
nr:CHAD domain-containing protein [Streptomyces malaysiensis]